MESFLQGILTWTSLHPIQSGLLIFVIAMLESLLVVGLLIPGAFLLFGIGALIATGNLQLYPVMAWTAAGAIAGDSLSFLIGRHFHERLRVVWPFRRYPALVNRGIDFFYRHGGKSVFMARFVGPVRPIVPAIAGMMDMPIARFLLVDLIASLLWAPAYILPGMVFGASLGLAAEVAGRLVVLLIIAAGMIWLSVEMVRIVGHLLQPRLSAAMESLLAWSRNHPRIRPLAGSLLDPDHPEARGLAILSALSFFALWLLLLTLQQVLQGRFLGDIDNYIHQFLLELRTPWAYQANVFLTQLGDPVLLALLVAAGSTWLFWKGYGKAAFHWLGVYGCTAILTYVLKYSAQVERPPGFSGYSFPSGHTSISLAVYGFLALLIARELPLARRWIPYSIAGVLVTTIAFSRLYLGSHWFSDILGGASLGLFWVALIGIAYDRHPAPDLPVKRLLGVMAGITILALSWQVQHQFRPDIERYALRSEIRTVSVQDWRDSFWQTLPAYRVDLEGVDVQPLNVQWAGSLHTLQEVLSVQGWHQPPHLGVAGILNWLAPDPDISDLPILPQVHDGRHHQLQMILRAGEQQRLTILRLWPANVELREDGRPLWLGTVSYLKRDRSIPLITFLGTARDFNAPLQVLRAALAGQVTLLMKRRDLPAAPAGGWDGSVLLAEEPGS